MFRHVALALGREATGSCLSANQTDNRAEQRNTFDEGRCNQHVHLNLRGGFRLTGAHATAQCSQCHVNNNYSLTSAACWNCHQTDYNNTNNPPHKQASFPQDCSGCHSMVDWTGATFNHATTGFTLVGLHATQQCTACHANNNYTLNSTACWG